ncbi:MAG: TRAP transporter large permease subunit [Betaproteobacteria bacterium]|jgi:tripartite ATP-independent transporter DctM subunit|nr:TRAP transporter large permease subunit [Betaproteobacteria bacterium]MBK7081695.1 TRAP transporter large permease subunit [Betaproteobacteria bacterium]MBK7744375.1 TRAP transporter large permease subunit [Betaproteobacteria bacterium]MBK7793577.1 TRAP transporter large permease subunit [Betaproteobacteria bacterium]MBK8689112.1 TRAP transporter large permease subunit [Betaproteobacteria bacterium]
MTVTIFMVSLCGAMFVGMPVAFALLVCAVSLMVYLISIGTLDTFNTQIMAQYLISGADNFPLMAIPFFMLAGEIMTRGGISQQIVKIANTLVGHVRGGLGYVAIMAGLVLASISGSAAADTAALAAVVIPLMRDAKYNVPRSAGLIAGAGCIAPILPPAMPLVLFGVVSQLSITKLFFTGIFPGLLMATSLVITWRFVARKDFKEAPKQKFAFGPLLKALREGIWALSLPVIILGGMKTGAFTPTEAAVVAAVTALLISLFVYKGLKIRDLPKILLTAAKTCSAIMLIVAASMVVAWLITIAEIPGQVTAMMQPFMHNKLLLMAVLMLLVFAVAIPLDLAPTVLILTPVLMPLVKEAGIDPYYFGIMFMMNNAIGLITPPVGTVLNVVSGVARVNLDSVIKGMWPFLIAETLVMFLLVLFPDLVIVPARWFY